MNYTLNFVCRSSKSDRSGMSPVELTISQNYERVFLSLPMKYPPQAFKRDYMKKSSTLRRFCDAYTSKVQATVLSLLERGIDITPKTIKDGLKGKSQESVTVGRYLRDVLVTLRKRVDVDMSLQRYLKYSHTAKLFIDLTGRDRRVSTLCRQDIEDFVVLLKRSFKDSTSKGKYSILKTLLDDRRDLFRDVRPHFRSDNTIRYLTEEELSRIEAKEFSIERMENVRDLFLLQCYTALSYCDMAGLRKEDIIIDESGRKYIHKSRQKTGVPFIVLLLPKAEAILEKYNYTLPLLSNQKYNSYLKEVADICSVRKNLTSHVGRHTAATTMLNAGLSIEVVAKILGHSSTKMTHHYAKMLDRSVLTAMESISDRI